MIYFLVNNNYHLLDVYEHCKNLRKFEKSLIQIPHTLECISKDENFNNIFIFKTPFSKMKNYFNIINVKKIERKVKSKLTINANDILFVYTEYEILNQYIITLFKKNGAKVYVIEDGGFPTYLTYSIEDTEPLSLKEKIKLFYFNYFLGYRFVNFLKYNNLIFPQINENYLDGVLLYLDINIVRNIKKFLLSKNKKQLDLDKSKALFLNEKIYEYYCSKSEYSDILKICIEKMIDKFEIVYFKFHPKETEENKLWQLKILNQYSNVEIIQDNSPVENLLVIYKTKYVFSFLSAALLNLNAQGAVPVYIYHWFDNILENNVFQNIDNILHNIGYKFINKNCEITDVGFSSKNYDDLKLDTFLKEIK
ncbi:polysialyltransferase family glycosyltransferase [Sulfurimonas sp. C5]|uniref:polysialyltransferase family glycosyltransferase n=1 Tax=Sulfurimonas sp. C5 TaxID=3036947 RepID=UPI002453F85B|nr:polysialyltransferase family glycosyltransferase [Sulfurimonas sp. C5]MDH4944068.1 polysialyltransferase family glycosyltransferase [Sulfurimonas sp. C5]